MPQLLTVPAFAGAAGPVRLAAWLAEDGQELAAGQAVCAVEVDKVTVELAAEAGGVVRHGAWQPGQRLAAGAVLAVLLSAGETLTADLAAQLGSGAGLADQARLPVPSLVPEEAPDLEDGPAEPLDAMRAVVARRMTISKLSAPHFYLTTVVDMTAAAELRQTLKAQGVKATYNDMLIKAAGLALRKYPRVASVYTPAGYVPRSHMNVGFAVAVEPEGLVVPVIREADRKTLAQVSGETKELIARTKNRRLTPADYAEGVFSISNLGTFEVEEFTAIVNPGEAAILAVGKVADQPCVRKGEVVVRPLLRLTLSSDHRVIDGVLAARFNGYLKTLLEAPTQLI